jgi:hypothetical protein
VHSVSVSSSPSGDVSITFLLEGALYKMVRNMVGTAVACARGGDGGGGGKSFAGGGEGKEGEQSETGETGGTDAGEGVVRRRVEGFMLTRGRIEIYILFLHNQLYRFTTHNTNTN